MYEIRCKVSDAKLPNALRALSGLTFGLPTVTVDSEDEVKVATPKVKSYYTRGPYKPKRRPPVVSGSSTRKGEGAVVILRDLIAKHPSNKFTAREVKEATLAIGYSPGAYSHALKILRAENTIRPLGFGHYEILKKPEQAAE